MANEIKNVLLAGGTGFIGTFLKNQLIKNGIKTCLVSRMPRPDSITWEELNENGLPPHTDAIINVAGQNVLDPLRRWTPGFKQNVIASRVHTNQMLASAILKSSSTTTKPKVFITISGVGYYEPHPTKIYDEFSSGGQHDFLSKLCSEWEAASKVNDNNIRNVIIRSGIVLGRNGGIIQQMYPLFYLGFGAKIGSGKQWMPWIHLEDLCQIFLQAMLNQKFSGIINGVAPQSITNEQFTKIFAKLLKRPSFLMIPEQFIELIFGQERAVMMTRGQNVISKRILEELNYKMKYPNLEMALKNIIFD